MLCFAEISLSCFGQTDTVPQSVLDGILWKSVHGAQSDPPPAGPNAENEGADRE